MRGKRKPSGKGESASFVIGRERFAKISAVEGIALSSEMTKRAAEFDAKRLPDAERRRAIMAAYRKKA